jgi:aerobic carbon-monoxide dehydrogenase medium subunit
MSILGTRVVRTEDPRLLTAGGIYVDDLRVPELEGAARVTFVRSPIAHAAITGIDVSAARQAPGVIAVLTVADLDDLPPPPDDPGMSGTEGAPLPMGGPWSEPLFAADRVRFVGHGDGGRVAARRESAALRGRGQDGSRRQLVPVHRIPQHRESGAGSRGRDPGLGGEASQLITAPFTYKRAASVDEALGLAGDSGEEAKFLAGGHSLLPLMKLRLAVPDVLIDIGRLAELSYVRDEGSHVAVGALTTHDEVARSLVLAAHVPLLAHAAGCVGDPQVRHRGTIGGSLAHADPAADLPAVVLSLDATLVARGPGGTREIGAREFFSDLFETALRPGELLTEIRVPKGNGGWSFQKFAKRGIDWAIVGVAVQASRVTLINMGSTPIRAAAVEAALASGASPRDAAAHAAEGTSAPDDLNGSRRYREHLARVLVGRALDESSAGSRSG